MGSGLPEFANVGLIVYGHKGTADPADQAASCNGVELIEPLLGVNVPRTEAIINQIEPKGWTGLAKALEVAEQTLSDKELAQNFVIILSDGKETCGGDPVAVANRLRTGGSEVVTNVVGFVVGEEERQQLELISQAGGGRYFVANSREELQKALLLSAEAVKLWDQVNQCIIDNLSGYGQCINVQYLRALNYVTRLRTKLSEDTGGPAGGGFIDRQYEDLYWNIWRKFNQLREENWQQYDRDLKQLYPG